jgi:hypothetical protein
MTQLPQGLVSRLRQATVLGELGQIGELVDEIGNLDGELGAWLASLAHRFDHEEILLLLRRHSGESHERTE